MKEFFEIIYILGALSSVAVAVWAVLYGKQAPMMRRFAVVASIIGGWSFSQYQSLVAGTEWGATFWQWSATLFILAFSVYWMQYVVAYLGLRMRRQVTRILLSVGIILACLSLIARVFERDWFLPPPMIGVTKLIPESTTSFGFWAVQLVFGIVAFISLWFLYQRVRKVEASDKFRQAYILMMSALAFIGIVGTFSTNVFGLTVASFGAFFVFLPLLLRRAVTTYAEFSARILASEFLAFLISGILFARLYVGDAGPGQIINALVFFASLGFGFVVLHNLDRGITTRRIMGQLVRQLESANERLLVLDKQKSDFISIASHQLRTPLTAIKGYASLLLEGSFGPLPEAMHEPLRRIFKSSQRLVMIIENFLTMSRLERGKMTYRLEAKSVVEMAKQALEELQVQSENKGVHLSFHSNAVGDVIAEVDAMKMKQAIHNLLHQAILRTEEGRVDVVISVNLATDHALIAVSDTGHGADQMVINALFAQMEMNSLSDYLTDTSQYELYISREIVIAHHGKIWAESAGEGQGTTIFIELPIVSSSS